MYTYPTVTPAVADTVSHNFCSGCGLCALNCPTHAIIIEEQALLDGQRRKNTVLIPQCCVHCGRCAAVCPSGAIQQFHMEDLLHRVAATRPHGLAFFCTSQNQHAPCVSTSMAAGGTLLDGRRRARLQDALTVPAGVLLEEVRCMGRIGSRLLLRLALAGVRQMAFFACPPDHCEYGQGGLGIHEHVEATADLLAQYNVTCVHMRVYDSPDCASMNAIMAAMSSTAQKQPH